MEELPFDIVREILCRLPVKSLVRFRCLSKIYRRTIDDPDLARIQNSLVGEEEPVILFNFDWWKAYGIIAEDSFIRPTTYLVEDEDGDNIIMDRYISAEAENGDDSSMGNQAILNNINDLCKEGEFKTPRVCMAKGLFLFKFITKVALYNPLNRKHFVLPPLDTSTTYHAYALGFDGTEYKVICVKSIYSQGLSSRLEAQIYSFKTKSWRKTKSGPPPPGRYYDTTPVFVNGSLYWVSVFFATNNLVSFDMKTEEFSSSELPSAFGVLMPELFEYEYGRYLGFVAHEEVRVLVESKWKILDAHNMVDGVQLTDPTKFICRRYSHIFGCKGNLISLD